MDHRQKHALEKKKALDNQGLNSVLAETEGNANRLYQTIIKTLIISYLEQSTVASNLLLAHLFGSQNGTPNLVRRIIEKNTSVVKRE